MRKIVVFGLFIILVSSLSWVLPASAQDIPACTQAELDDSLAGMDAILQSYSEMGDMAFDDPDSLTGAVAGFEALSTGYWDEVYPLIPDCVELIEL